MLGKFVRIGPAGTVVIVLAALAAMAVLAGLVALAILGLDRAAEAVFGEPVWAVKRPAFLAILVGLVLLQLGLRAAHRLRRRSRVEQMTSDPNSK